MATDIADLGIRVDSRGFVSATKDMARYRKEASQAETTTQRLARQMDELGGKMQGVGRSATLRLTAPLVAMAGAGVAAFSKFDDAMTQSLAIMGDVSDEMRNEMSQSAREMAKQTTFSATQAAESYFFLASAGLDAEQSVAALPQVAKFAQAGMFDMATATDLATDAQSALRMTSDDAARNLENLTKVTDTLVGANTLANASVQQFSEALTNKAGNAMAQLNIEIESGVAVLAAWADQGVKGTEAGERFNIVTRDLQRAARNNREEFEKMNIAVFDSEGNFRNMADITADLEGAMAGMSVEQQGATLQMLGFQDRSVQALRSLIGLSDQVREYEERLRDMGGITDEVANNQLKSFSAQMDLTKSRINDVFITIGEALVPTLQDLNEEANGIIPKIAELAEKFRDADSTTKNLIIGAVALVAALGPLLIILGTLIRAVSTLIPLLTTMRGIIFSMTGVFAAVGVAIAAAAVAIERQFVPGMKEVGLTEQILNVLTRAWIVLSETIKAGAQLTLAMAQTMVGAVRTVIAPIEGMVRGAASAMDKLINKDFAGAKAAIMGIGDEIAEASKRGREQMMEGMEGMTEWWDELPDRADKVMRKVAETRDAMLDAAKAGKETGKGMNMLSGSLELAMATFEAFGGQVTETNEQLEETNTGVKTVSESVLEFEAGLRDQIDALRRQKLELQGGTRAVLMYELAQLKAGDATEEQVRMLEELIDQVVTSEEELEELERRLESAGENFMGMGDAIETAMEMMAEANKLAQKEFERTEEAMAALEDTALRGLDRMSAAFSAFITGEIESFREFGQVLNQIMEQTMTDMVNQVIQNRQSGAVTGSMTEMEGWTAAGALGSMAGGLIGGQKGGAVSGAAQGMAMGAVFGPWGAAIGAIIGGLIGFFGTERPPRYDLAGQNTYDTAPGFRATNPESFETELGTVWANFRRMEGQQEEAIKSAIRSFDAAVVEVVGDEFLDQAKEAIKNFAFESRFEGEDPAVFLQKRFDFILGTFDDFTRGLVQQEGTLEDQMQMLSDVLNIRKLVDSGEGIADLGFEELTLTIIELRRGTETLGEAFQRVKAGLEEYAGIAAELQTHEMTAGLNDFQSEMVNVQLESLRMQEALHNAAKAAGLEAARTEDLARVHELTANRMSAVIGRMEEAGRSLVEGLFGTELTRLQDEISAAREGGAEDEDIAGLLERQEELRREAEERERVQQARELSQIVADMAQASGDSFEQIAQRLGFDLSQLSGVLGMSPAAFEQMLEDMQVDPLALATEIQGMTDAIVAELILLPGAFADALATARDQDENDTTVPVTTPPGPPGDGGGGGGGGSQPGPPGDGGFIGPHDIGNAVETGMSDTTQAVRDLDGNIVNLIGGQQEVSASVAAALNNLASAIRSQERDRSGRTRSSRTRAEIS